MCKILKKNSFSSGLFVSNLARLTIRILVSFISDGMDDDKLLAILMATHTRLGANSPLNHDMTVLIAYQYHMKVRQSMNFRRARQLKI